MNLRDRLPPLLATATIGLGAIEILNVAGSDDDRLGRSIILASLSLTVALDAAYARGTELPRRLAVERGRDLSPQRRANHRRIDFQSKRTFAWCFETGRFRRTAPLDPSA